VSPSELDSLNRQRVVARLLSAAVHDARNSLQGISGTAELVSMALASGAVVEDRLQSILRQSAWLGGRLELLLSLSMETSTHREHPDVAHCCRQAISLRQASWGRQRITADIVMASPPAMAHANGTAVLRILLNLLLNAEQSLVGVGGGSIRLAITHEDGVVVRVRDSGAGVTAAESACLFATHTAAGTLATGLAASRLLADAHGGALAWGGAEQPSTFTLRLPSGG
jgi:signal transduction histidine kinase